MPKKCHSLDINMGKCLKNSIYQLIYAKKEA